METQQSLTADERRAIVLRGNTWGYNFLVFTLFVDIMYRAVVFDEAAWDLFAIIFASGIISLVYAMRHNILILNRTSVVLMALMALVAGLVGAVVAFILALTNAM
jgi:hypothetical protein